PACALDPHRRAAGFLGDFTVLFQDEPARGFVAVEPAEQFGRHAPVGALGVVFINDIEKGKFAFWIGPGFLGHAGLSSIGALLSKKNSGAQAGRYGVAFPYLISETLPAPALGTDSTNSLSNWASVTSSTDRPVRPSTIGRIAAS